MKEFIEKLIERLREKSFYMQTNRNRQEKFIHTETATEIVNQLAEEYKPKTRADKIRSMSDEELAEYMFGVSIGNAPCVLCLEECDFCELPDEQCKEKTLQWLQSEAE